ncbi:MAG: hypothetical protein LBO67_07210 [Spirochaetaceae bacterium]|nr:hypothetical protein [Spirochaetaceae bacterium]
MTRGVKYMETIQTIPEWKVAADEIWAVLKETDRIMKENAKEQALRLAETDRIMKEDAKEQAERSADLDKKIERVSANVGGLNRSMGELIENLIAARLWEKFPEYGLVRSYQRVPIYDEKNRIKTDIDILLSNTDKVMAVEVKHELNKVRDVDEHLKRMELIRKYPPLETVNKQLLGAMAGGVVSPEIMAYAYEAGFYVLELTGESVHLVPPPAGFTPRQW